LKRAVGRPVEKRPSFKALDGINFQVEAGEVVGIIGTNGAGKSTLLKILASISIPTRGSVKVNGTVAPLIEVGAGLVGDLTGRENIFLNGSILGLSRQTIREKFDEIVAFAELENFMNTDKRYSRGRWTRFPSLPASPSSDSRRGAGRRRPGVPEEVLRQDGGSDKDAGQDRAARKPQHSSGAADVLSGDPP
jgi:ABC-type glutathione transport system ATPase component